MLETVFQIRPVKESDLDQVEKINWTCLPENYNRFFYLDIYRRFPKTFIVALVNDRVVGYIICRIETGFSEIKRLGLAKKGHVISLAVLPEYRKKGVGKSLTTEALKRMKDYGVSESFLEVRETNETAINLYKKVGFEPIRKIIGYYRDGEDAYVMARRIQAE